jgi:hypothetical protein
MTGRERKLRFIQIILLIFGSLIILYTYTTKQSFDEKIISKKSEKEIKKKLANVSEKTDVFFNVEYSGLDFSGNRYIIKSKKAFSDRNNQQIVEMEEVTATFYFKDGSELNVLANNGFYNNSTLDMDFFNSVEAFYEGSELFASKAKYSNTNSFLKISENVRINDINGTMDADELIFNMKKQELDISSNSNGVINTNLNLK